MQVVKYFYEEPVALEVLTRDEDPDARAQADGQPTLDDFLRTRKYYRGYLAASDIETGRIGATVLPESITTLMRATLPSPAVHVTTGARLTAGQENSPVSLHAADRIKSAADLRAALTDRSMRSLIVAGREDLSAADETVARILGAEAREVLAPITRLLDSGATLLMSEPSHDGHDWTVFSPVPIADRIRAAMADHLSGVRGYVIPYARARGEHRFYFEQYDPEMFAEFRII